MWPLVAALAVTPVSLCLAQSDRPPTSPVTIEPLVAASRDSDGDSMLRLGLALDVPAGAGGRIGVMATRGEVADGIDRVRTTELLARGSFKPGPRTNLDASIGGNSLDLSGTAASLTVIPTGSLRLRWRSAGRLKTDLRARRNVVDGSPTLVASRVVREEIGGTLDLPLAGPLGLRGVGRVAGIASRFDRNTRTQAAGMMVLALSPAVEVSGQIQRLSYAHATTAGYFAPRVIQAAKIGTYTEFEGDRVSLALDASAGAERLAEQGAPELTAWRRALGLWSMISYAVGGGASIRLELEAYDAPSAAIAATGAGWRYGFASMSLRWKLG